MTRPNRSVSRTHVERVELVMTPSDRMMLEALAAREGCTMSEALRRLVRRQHAAQAGAPR